MPYSNDDIRELYQKICQSIMNSNKYGYKITSLEDLQKEPKWKEVNFQDKCEGGHSLGDLLLKSADENDNSSVSGFLLQNGFKLPEQEQVAAANEEEEEKNTPNVEEDRAEPSNKNEDDQFSTSYNKIRKIVASNPNITAEEFCNELKKEKIDIKITNQDGWTLPHYAVHSEGPYITGDRSIFLNTVKLLTNLNIRIDFKDTASRTVLGTAAINKQTDVIKILLDSGKFNEEEKFNALRLAIVQGNVQEVEAFLGHVNDENRQAALELAMNNTQEEITQVLLNFITPETSDVEENGNRAGPSSSNGNIGSRPVNTPNGQLNHNNEDETPVAIGTDQVITTLSVEESKTEPSSSNESIGNIRTHGDDLSNHTITPNSGNGQHHNNKNKTPVSTRTDQTATPNNDNKTNGFVDAQFSSPHKKETKYKENKESFYTSLRNDAVGVIVTGLFIAAAVMVPSVAGAVVCGVAAILVAIATGLHVKNSTLPSYREMRENKVECVNSSLRTC